MRVSRMGVLLAAALLPGAGAASTAPRWDRDVGKAAPPLVAADWVGTPVSLDSVKGNTVVLAFWNADIPC